MINNVLLKPNQSFHYTCRITLKRATSLQCPSPRHSAKATHAATCVDAEAVANRLQRCVRFGRPLGFELLTYRTRGTILT